MSETAIEGSLSDGKVASVKQIMVDVYGEKGIPGIVLGENRNIDDAPVTPSVDVQRASNFVAVVIPAKPERINKHTNFNVKAARAG